MVKPKTKAISAVEKPKLAAKPSARISKARRAVGSVRVARDMQSFFEGGPFSPVPGGKALGLFSGHVAVVSLESKEVVLRIRHEEENISQFAVFVRGAEVAVFTATSNGLIRKLRVLGDWAGVEVEEVRKVPKFAAAELRLDDAGKFLVAANAAGDVKIFGTKGLDVLRECRLGTGHLRVRLLGSYVAFASRSRTVALYNILSNKKVRVFKTPAEDAFADFCLIDSAKKQLLIAGLDGRLWVTLEDGGLALIDKREAGITAIEAVKSGKGTFIFIGLENGKVDIGRVEDQHGPAPKFTLLETTLAENRYTIAGFSMDVASGRIFTMTEEGTVFVQRLRTKKSSGRVSIETVDTLIGLNDHITEVKFLSENQFFVCSNSEAIRWHNLETNATVLLRGHEELCTSIDVFRDQRMITGSKDGRVFLWDITVPEPEGAEAEGEEGAAPGQLPKAQTSVVVRKKYKAHTGNIASLSFGQRTGEVFVSAGSEGQIKLWDLSKGTCKSIVVDVKEINSAHLSFCEKLVAVTGHDKRVFLYSTPDLEQVAAISAHERSVWEAVFSQDSKKLATGSSDHKVKVFDVSDPAAPKEEIALEGHAASVLKVKWFFNDLQLISAGADGVMKIWNVRKGTCLFTSEKMTGRVWAMDVWERLPELSGDSRAFIKILAGDNDDNLVLFEDDTQRIDSDLIAAEQEQDRAIDEVKLALENRDFAEGLRKSFRANMPRQFFSAFQKWYNHCLFATPLVFNFDETTTKELYSERTLAGQERFAGEAGQFVSELMEEDFSRLLLLTKNSITNSRTAFFAQLLLQSIINNLNLARNAEYKRQLAEKGNDWKQLLEIISIFVDRSQLSAEKALKQALQLDFELEAINLR